MRIERKKDPKKDKKDKKIVIDNRVTKPKKDNKDRVTRNG